VLVPVVLCPVLLNPVLLVGDQRLETARISHRGHLLPGCQGLPANPRHPCLGIRSDPRGGISTIQGKLLHGGTPLPAGGALPVLDSGDQVVLAHTGNVGDAHLTGQLAQVGHHHSGQPATATHRSIV
jgi:hypothetical protein